MTTINQKRLVFKIIFVLFCLSLCITSILFHYSIKNECYLKSKSKDSLKGNKFILPISNHISTSKTSITSSISPINDCIIENKYQECLTSNKLNEYIITRDISFILMIIGISI